MEEIKVSKQNGVQAWIVLVVITLCGIVAAASVMKINPCASLIMADFGIGESMEGYLLSVCSIVGVIIAIPAGGIIDKFGPRAVGIVSLALTIIGGVVGSITSSYVVLLVARALEGFSFGTWAIIGPIFVNAWFDQKHRGLPMGIFSVWVGWCMLFIFRVANLVIDHADPASWRNVWWLTVIAAIVCLVLFVVLARMPKGAAVGGPAAGRKEPAGKVPWSSAVKSVPVWCLVIIFFLFSWAQQVVTGFTSTYCQSQLGMDIISANSVTSSWTLGNVIGALLVGFVLNKIVKTSHRGIMIIVVSVFSLITYATCFSYQADMANVYLLITGFLCIMYTPIGFNTLPDVCVSPKTLGITMALASCSSMIGHVFVAFGGIAIETSGYGGCSIMLIGIGVVYLITAIVFYVSVKKKEAARASSPASE